MKEVFDICWLKGPEEYEKSSKPLDMASLTSDILKISG